VFRRRGLADLVLLRGLAICANSAVGGRGEKARNRWQAMAGVESKQPAAGAESSRALSFGMSLVDPRAWAHLLRMVHYYNYSHVQPRRLADIGPGVRMAPNVSMMNAERIKIGAYSHIGARCSLWAGKTAGRVILGHHALLGPEVFITAANYRLEPGTPIMDQPMDERDVVIGADVWLGARVVVGAGVEIGDGSVVAAHSFVTRSLPAGSIAGGNPARIIGRRGDPMAEADGREADVLLDAFGAG
jgi:acetyltransferase-like isoleucine patch superfamily enzyme